MMKTRARTALLLLLCVGTIAPTLAAAPVSRCPAPPLVGAVATVDARATAAGLAALRAGGNAVDAAVTAALTLGVVNSHNSGIGGGCFMLVRRANGEVLAIDGREMAPAAATRDMYVRDGKADARLSTKGALAIGIPGSLAAYDLALRRVGRRTLAEALAPGARLAYVGVPVSAPLALRLQAKAEDLASFDAASDIFLDADGAPHGWGHRLVQRDLAGTYFAIREHGIGWFYGGPFAQALEAWMRANGGVSTAADFAAYRVRVRKPLRTTYRGYEVIGFPPPSSGGLHVAQILRILEGYDLRALQRKAPALRRHVMAEAMKLAFADRAHWLGDPDFVDVPRGLCDGGYCGRLRRRIDPGRAEPVEGHGRPPRADTDLFDKHTTHVAAADSAGNWVAITTTLNTSFGSKVVIPGTGVLMNNQMDDFAAQPGVPNAYGLVGAEANAIAPGKRPLSSMSPTLVLRDGRPLLTIGAAGGPTIITQVVQALVNHLDLGMPLDRAVAEPRIHHQWRPDLLFAEPDLDPRVVAGLRLRGHPVTVREAMGVTQAIRLLRPGCFVAVSDERNPGTIGGRARTTRPGGRRGP